VECGNRRLRDELEFAEQVESKFAEKEENNRKIKAKIFFNSYILGHFSLWPLRFFKLLVCSLKIKVRFQFLPSSH